MSKNCLKDPDCPAGQICSGTSNKCIAPDKRAGKAEMKRRAELGASYAKASPKARSASAKPKPKSGDCPDGMIYRQKTGKCVKEDGAIGKRIKKAAELGLTEEQYEALPKDKRKAEDLAKTPERAEKIKRKHITPKCISKSKLPLRDVQIKTVEHLMDHESLLVVHGTGMGKTLTAVTAAECYLASHPDGKVIVVTGLSLVNNFKETLDKYGSRNKKRYEIYNYDKFLNKYKAAKKAEETDKETDEEVVDPCGCKDSMLIIDEIHTLKNYEGQRFIAAMECAKYADKVLLMTATPYLNSVCDLIAIINLLHRKYVVAPKKKINDKVTAPIYFAPGTTKISNCNKSSSKLSPSVIRGQMNLLAPFLQGKISFAEKPLGGDYPRVEMHKITIPMNEAYEKAFHTAVSEGESDIFSNPKAFYNGYRRAVNRISKNIGASAIFSDKLKYASKHIIKKDVSGNVIFSNWLKFGVEVISDFLDKKNISYAVISGETPVEERKKYVDAFNRGDINTLVISSAGGTGLDLRGVQNIIVLDPVWNAAQLDQIIGRGVRYRSHVHLPKEKQKVNVYLLTLVETAFYKGLQKTSKSGDYLLYKIIESKKKFGKIVDDILKRISVVDNAVESSPV